MADVNRIHQLEDLLRRAGGAHHVFEQTELHGVYDEVWHEWYAAWVLENGFNQLLDTGFDIPTLAQALMELNNEHKQATSGENWAQYTARRIVEAVSG